MEICVVFSGKTGFGASVATSGIMGKAADIGSPFDKFKQMENEMNSIQQNKDRYRPEMDETRSISGLMSSVVCISSSRSLISVFSLEVWTVRAIKRLNST